MKLHHLAVCYGNVCNRKCKYCIVFNPYFSAEQRKSGANLSQTISDVSKIAEACDTIGTISVAARGEVFIAKDIDKLMDAFFSLPNVNNIYLLTNGAAPLLPSIKYFVEP